jgi:hypothetical protein
VDRWFPQEVLRCPYKQGWNSVWKAACCYSRSTCSSKYGVRNKEKKKKPKDRIKNDRKKRREK